MSEIKCSESSCGASYSEFDDEGEMNSKYCDNCGGHYRERAEYQGEEIALTIGQVDKIIKKNKELEKEIKRLKAENRDMKNLIHITKMALKVNLSVLEDYN